MIKRWILFIKSPRVGGIINNLYSSEQDESRRQESLEEKKEKKGVGES